MAQHYSSKIQYLCLRWHLQRNARSAISIPLTCPATSRCLLQMHRMSLPKGGARDIDFPERIGFIWAIRWSMCRGVWRKQRCLAGSSRQVLISCGVGKMSSCIIGTLYSYKTPDFIVFSQMIFRSRILFWPHRILCATLYPLLQIFVEISEVLLCLRPESKCWLHDEGYRPGEVFAMAELCPPGSLAGFKLEVVTPVD